MINVMLAASTTGEDLTYPLLASPKLDGVRAVVHNGVVMSRRGKCIPNDYVQSTLGKKKYEGFDGELIVGNPTAPDVYRKTMSGVMSGDGKPVFTFHVFDNYVWGDRPFHQREEQVRIAIARETGRSRIGEAILRTVPHVGISDYDELMKLEARWLAHGWEGVMLRDPFAAYKFGRSTAREGGLLKLKRFHDEEAVIVAVKELEHNTNEQTRDELGRAKRSSHKAGKRAGATLGALTCECRSFREQFNIGTGFDQSMRDELWNMRTALPGKLIKFKHMPVGAKDRPRFPVFLGFRDPIDA